MKEEKKKKEFVGGRNPSFIPAQGLFALDSRITQRWYVPSKSGFPKVRTNDTVTSFCRLGICQIDRPLSERWRDFCVSSYCTFYLCPARFSLLPLSGQYSSIQYRTRGVMKAIGCPVGELEVTASVLKRDLGENVVVPSIEPPVPCFSIISVVGRHTHNGMGLWLEVSGEPQR